MLDDIRINWITELVLKKTKQRVQNIDLVTRIYYIEAKYVMSVKYFSKEIYLLFYI